MEVIDIVIAVILLFGFVKGLMKGLFVEIASLVALIAGIYGAIHFSFYVKDILIQYVDWEPKYISLTAFAITFVIIVVSISLAGKLLTKIASLAALGLMNKILGGIFGCLKLALIMSVLLGWFERINVMIPFIGEKEIENSILYTPTKNLAPAIFPVLLNKLDDFKEKENDKDKDKKIY
ncbi:CvpA family protein [Wenyingzhuangia sp. chi5]|uniref:CvpA family protein n=1 Tax=Wenyingzhuangia gilva TaxID=3057677 RepID=A0ABT8VPS9_9FLAO|nr:CvpA family protein [Wenyingzhuangia sp. chi5]MDO3693984.1 CvpA family protein [Wenyingzhuangia sp. chi5]